MEHCHRESAKCAAASPELALVEERHLQESADCAAVLAETTLADKHHCQEAAEGGTMLGETALAKEQCHSLLAVQATESALAAARVGVLAVLALPNPALVKDKQRQEEAAAEQCRADDECFMAPVMPPDPVNAANWRIWAYCALRAVPLDAILAKIERKNIAHKARAPTTTTSPHPVAMLSTHPCPMTYVGAELSTLGGSTRATSLALALCWLYDGQLRTVQLHARHRHHTGCHHRPCSPSPPEEVLPSHPHPMLGGLPTPTKTLITLVQATTPCCSVVSSTPTSSMTSSTPSHLPFTFSSQVLLSLGGGTTHPFCVGGLNPPPRKCSRCKHQPHHAG
jgi:hypothetical protein